MSDMAGKIDVWVTKYALTTGVFVSRGVATPEGSFCGTGCGGMSVTRREWARTHAEAIVQVKAMVSRRRDALCRESHRLLDIENGLVQDELPMAKERT